MAHYDFTTPVPEGQVRVLRVNDTVTLNGTLYGIRDATLIHMFDRGRRTRFDLRGHALIHTAPNVRWVGETQATPTGYEPVCVGTTTSARMERFTHPLMREYGARILIGKGGLGAGSLTAFTVPNASHNLKHVNKLTDPGIEGPVDAAALGQIVKWAEKL